MSYCTQIKAMISGTKNVVLFALLILSFQITYGQTQHPISVALHRLLDTGNFREASETINTYTINELTSLPDSTLFDYYYLQAAIKGNDGDETNKRKYLIDAKKTVREITRHTFSSLS